MTATSEVRPNVRAVAAAIRRWLASGAAQSPTGAYCAWLEATTGALAYEYPAISGGALTWLSGRRDPSPRELAAGTLAAEWLHFRLVSGDRSARAGWDRGAVYTFDLGMMAAGLISFGALVGEQRFLDRGHAIARDLAAYVTSPLGLRALAPDAPPTGRGDDWSTTGRAHLVKCVQALLLAGQRRAADRLALTTMDDQRADGSFRTQAGDDLVMLHAQFCAVEGLWIWGVARGDAVAVRRARAAVEFAWEYQLASGGLPRFVAADELGPEQLDVTSQAVRAAILVGLEPPGLHRAISRLVALTVERDGAAALIGRPGAAEKPLDTSVTMFAAQALGLAADRQAVRWRTLV
jgi:hypothetical protein